MGFKVDKTSLGHTFLRVPWFFTRQDHSTNGSYPFSYLSATMYKLKPKMFKEIKRCVRINRNTAALAELLKLWGEERNLFLTIFIQKYDEVLLCSGYKGILFEPDVWSF
jgi:hypothetical protein